MSVPNCKVLSFATAEVNDEAGKQRTCVALHLKTLTESGATHPENFEKN